MVFARDFKVNERVKSVFPSHNEPTFPVGIVVGYAEVTGLEHRRCLLVKWDHDQQTTRIVHPSNIEKV